MDFIIIKKYFNKLDIEIGIELYEKNKK